MSENASKINEKWTHSVINAVWTASGSINEVFVIIILCKLYFNNKKYVSNPHSLQYFGTK